MIAGPAAADWLFDQALPLWCVQGLDPAGGFHDALDDEGAPVAGPRRLRVQARQVYVFARAGLANWPGPWREAVAHGLAFLNGEMRRPDGFVWSQWSQGQGEGLALYDQAHALLALAWAAHATGDADLERQAHELFAAIEGAFAAGGGAYVAPEGGTQPFLATPHMHLYEALLALAKATGDPVWRRRADHLAGFALAHLVQPAQGRVRPFADGPATAFEPGLAFEWGWLLLAGGQEACARPLIRMALDTGVDAAANRTLGSTAGDPPRLWGQTERLRALAALSAAGETELRPAARAARLAVFEFIDAAPPGLYRDLSAGPGDFDSGPARASSLYHLAGALLSASAAD